MRTKENSENGSVKLIKPFIAIIITVIITISSCIFYVASSNATQDANIIVNKDDIRSLGRSKINKDLAEEKFENIEDVMGKIYVKLEKIETKLDKNFNSK